jgi:K+-transporting ATPase ATPase C chain
MKTLMTAIRTALVTLVITGIAYPLSVTVVARYLFPEKAAGSLVTDERGNIRGSSLIGQKFTHPWYFHPRPSAAGDGYDAMKSCGSNLGPASVELKARMERDLIRLKRENPEAQGPFPAELLTASGSGLDPHITPYAAFFQVPRIAMERNADEGEIRKMVEHMTEGRDLGIFGEPRVNVLRLNLALDGRWPLEQRRVDQHETGN